MTVPLPADLREGDLGPLGEMLGSGGQAKVFELPALSLPDVVGPLVYKQYKPGRAPLHGMSKIIALRARLGVEPGKLDKLDAATAWPVRQVVADDGAPLGLVLRRIPDSFMQDIRLPSGTVKTIPREVQFLFIPPDRALRGGTPTPTPTERLTICRDFAATLEFLHDELNVAFGDINARNAVFRIGEEPTVMFVDCDAVRVVGDMAVAPQLNAPDWDPPEGSGVLSRSTDLYKLGLFVLRCLTPDKNSSINRDPNQARGVLDAHGLTLLTDAVRGAPAQRPTAEAWHRYLRHALGEAFAPPRLDKVELDRTIVAAGEPLTVTWTAQEADTVTASGVGVPETVVRGVAGTGTFVLHPTRTGKLTITARNHLGEDSKETEAVGVFDLPSFVDLPVPMPTMTLPRPTPTELPSVARLFPPLPPVGAVPLPPLAHAWPDADPVRLVDGPPVFGFGPAAVPFDPASAFVAPVAPPPGMREDDEEVES